jgi:hypothetical protein
VRCTARHKLVGLGVALLLAVAVPACSHRQDDSRALRSESTTVTPPGDVSSSPPVTATAEDCPEEPVG